MNLVTLIQLFRYLKHYLKHYTMKNSLDCLVLNREEYYLQTMDWFLAKSGLLFLHCGTKHVVPFLHKQKQTTIKGKKNLNSEKAHVFYDITTTMSHLNKRPLVRPTSFPFIKCQRTWIIHFFTFSWNIVLLKHFCVNSQEWW